MTFRNLVRRAEALLPPEAQLARRALGALEAPTTPIVAAITADERRAIAVHPRRRSILDRPREATPREMIDGLRFDPVRQTFISVPVPKDTSWVFDLRLEQLLEWRIDALAFDAERALADRLSALAGTAIPPSFLGDVHAAGSPELRRAMVPLVLRATKGGDVLQNVSFTLSPRLCAELLRCFELERDALAARAAIRDPAYDERRAKLALVLSKHDGTPSRHPRVHWAFVNLATIGQTLAEMAADGGVLPRSLVRFEPTCLAGRFKDVVRLKVRFVLNDRLELNVLDDASYWRVVKEHGFPPNHEMLCATRPILASGYVTIDRGKIVALEDDGAMIPGKLPDRLPPIEEVLPALGFALDEAQVRASMRVIDWSGFRKACAHAEPARTTREALVNAAHGVRPALLAHHLQALAGLPRDAAIDDALCLLDGFRLINASARAVAAGELPKNAEHIDRTLAGCLLKKALG